MTMASSNHLKNNGSANTGGGELTQNPRLVSAERLPLIIGQRSPVEIDFGPSTASEAFKLIPKKRGKAIRNNPRAVTAVN